MIRTPTTRPVPLVYARVTTYDCVPCGERRQFLDLADGDQVDHRCGWAGTGGTWWVLCRGSQRSPSTSTPHTSSPAQECA